jgi:type II secretory pathway predicted ATPase ExeA
VDPFGVTCDPRLYVPRLGTEAALTALREGLALGRGVSVLSGPPGLGKTMVLQVLAAQLGGERCVLIPYAALGIEELAHYALDLLGEFAEPARATIALARAARRRTMLTLLLDDASALPIPTARALREIVDSLHGALRVIAAVVDDMRASAAIAALGDHVLHVRLRHPLARREVRDYVHGRIARAGAAFAHTLLGDETIDRIAAVSAGVPRVVNTLATWLLAEGEISRSGQRGVLFDGFETLDEA